MFQFSTTTLVNKFPSSKDTTEVGKKAYASAVVLKDNDGNTLDDSKVAFRVPFGPTFYKADKDCIDIFYTPFKDEDFDTLKITMPTKDADKTYRIAIYVRSQGNADPMYANDFVFKGRPFAVEFKGDKTAAQVKSIIERYQINTRDHAQFTVKADDTTITLTATNGYQRIYFAALQEWVPQEVVSFTYTEGHYKNLDVIDFEDLTDDQVDALAESNEITGAESKLDLTIGYEGKGTYDQILKDLRLPTGDNFAYTSVNAAQMPMIGGQYHQYTFALTKELKGYAGGIGINNPTTSVTYHHFFVEDGATENFEAGIKEALGITIKQGAGDETVNTKATISAADKNKNNVASKAETKA